MNTIEILKRVFWSLLWVSLAGICVAAVFLADEPATVAFAAAAAVLCIGVAMTDPKHF